MTLKKGSLVLVGTGIRSLGQLTLEAIEYIEKADKVYYATSDAATEGFIRARNKNAVDFYQYITCDEDIPKVDTYIQFAELIVADVRKGLNVVGAFYGHPGLFMSPNRRALAIAQAEGHKIKMLPGISSEDCLLADLGIDPSFAGCVVTDAPAFLMYDRPLSTSSHVIMYEVGQVGFMENGKSNGIDHFERLVKQLEEVYDASHSMVMYVAAISSIMEPVIDRLTIGDLYKPEVRKRISYITTFYFPPKDSPPLTNYVQDLQAQGQLTEEQYENSMFPRKPLYQLVGTDPLPEAYTEYAKKAIAGLASRKISSRYRAYSASPAMQRAVENISLNLDTREVYFRDKEAFAKSIEGLKDEEREALASGDFVRISSAMKNGQVDSSNNA